MKTRLGAVLRLLAAASLVLAYALLAHRATAAGAPTTLGALLAIGPLVAVAAALAWRSPRRGFSLALLGVACGGLWAAWEVLESRFGWIFFVQHAGTHLLLAIVFGRSLAAGREPLCTRIARAVQGPLPAEVALYTRRVTLAWTVFFVLMTAASTLLFAAGRMEAWSVLANLLTLPLVVLMFAAEYALRLRALPDWKHASLLDGIRGFRAAGGPSSSQPR